MPQSRKRQRKRQAGRPAGSTIPLERDRQRFAIAVWHGVRLCGFGPYVSAYWAAVVTAEAPFKPEDVEGLLTVTGTDVRFTASSLDKHSDALARKAERITIDSNRWLHASALAIKGLIIAARIGNVEIYCGMLDVLVDLGWRDLIERLRTRVDDLSKSNVPPHEGRLGRQGRALLDWLRTAIGEKTK
jgi:hypothetical protein